MGKTLRVGTAVAGHRRIWARRLAEARLGEDLAARIVTDWVILDDNGRLVRIPPDFGLSFTNPELSGEILRVALPVEDELGHASEIRFGVRAHDLDPMGHVNNAIYLDWVEEGLLATGADPGGLPRRSRLEYLASAAPGDEVVVTTWRDGLRWAARVARGTGEDLLRARGTLDSSSDREAIEGIPTGT
jgi:acyl-CoA thioesterase FadM